MPTAREARTYFNMQPNISHFKSGLLAHVNADEVGRILVENVDMAKPKQQQLLADGRREVRKEGHGSQAACESRCGVGKLSLPLRRGTFHMCCPVESAVQME
jgi:hypothetical protein